ncbi:MAG: HAD family phosphatase [Candidatus Peribacteraceae bacterium]|nr:HAD family phosphatase [Candidatus Peribacteraceae bacterium]
MKYSALLFDLDGTLVNSIHLWGGAIQEMFATMGISMTPNTFREFYRPSAHLGVWLQHFDVDPARKEELRAVRDAAYIRLLRKKVTWLPAAKEILDAFDGAIPMGLVTGSWMSYVDTIDARLSVKRYFQAIVTEDDMGTFSKPHPHGLQVAAGRLDVDPKRCLYVGDMLADVESSHAAGMPCCLVRGPYTAKEAIRQADFIIDTLRELPAITVP